MICLLLNSIALEPNRWTPEKVAYYKFDQLLQPIADADFHFVEIWEYHISRESESNIKKFRKMADSLDLRFPVIGIYPKLHLTGKERQQEMDNVEKIFNYAHILGIEIVKLYVGNLGAENITDIEYENSIEFVREMGNLSKSYGPVITGETHQQTLFDSTKSCRKFLKEVNLEIFKICFQPYNFRDTGQAINDYRTLASDVIHVHYQGRKNEEMELLEYSDMDYEALTGTLIEWGFEGYISIEFVKDCVVKHPEDFNMPLVLKNAQRDRKFLVERGYDYGSQIVY